MMYAHRVFYFSILLLTVFVFPADAQRRDFVSDAEAELIREHQEVDMRIEVLTKFIDRRLAAANIPGHKWSAPKKESEKWGEEPKGSRLELLSDIRRLLQKTIDDIDDIASRKSAAVEGNETTGKLFPKAVRNLSGNCARYEPIFQSELAKTTVAAERGLLMSSLELCTQIVEAAANLPAELKEEKKKKT